jgi:hypothetical protein
MIPPLRVAALAATVTLASLSPAHAGSGANAALGGALGAAAGAIVGDSLGGRDGAIVGSALGGALGAAAGTSHRHRHYYAAPARPVYVVPARPVYVVPATPVYVVPRGYGVGKHKHKGHHYDWD